MSPVGSAAPGRVYRAWDEPGLITSRSNARIRWIRSLKDRKERTRSGLFLVEGLRAVSEAIHHHADLVALVAVPEALEHALAQDATTIVTRRRVPCLRVTPEVFALIAERPVPCGVAAVVRQRWAGLDGLDSSRGLCCMALDSVKYPGNLGTVLRSCDAVGAAGVILLGNAADPFDPAAVRASMGAIFSRAVVRSSLGDLVRWKQRSGCRFVGASPHASADYRDARYEPPVVLMMGGESHGLSSGHEELCDEVVRIPMQGCCDSLNLAMAATLVLYEAFRQVDRREISFCGAQRISQNPVDSAL